MTRALRNPAVGAALVAGAARVPAAEIAPRPLASCKGRCMLVLGLAFRRVMLARADECLASGLVDSRTGPGCLAYVRRARTDAFEGAFGRFVRGLVERRIRSDAPTVLDALRRKREGGDPASTGS